MQRQGALVLALLLLGSLGLTSAASDVASPSPGSPDQLESLTRTVENLTSVLGDVQRDNCELRRHVTRLQEMMLQQLQARHSSDVTGKPPSPDRPRNTSSGGATYVRWGRTSCPPETELVYKGYAGGGYRWEEGAATNHLCLPEHPQYLSSVFPQTHAAGLYGTEYETYNKIFRNHDQDVPCAVCRSPTRTSAIMIPARTSCYPGFHREYHGYLMAGKWDHQAGSEFVCVDIHPESVAGGAANKDGKLLYFTIGRCGSLKCPPYVEAQEITCVVCSK